MRALTALLAALALVLGMTTAATAQTVPSGWYVLTMTSDHAEPAMSYRVLVCTPDGGTHPAPVRACRQLRAVNGHIAWVPADPGPCTLELNPTYVTARGWWHKTPRFFTRAYANPCLAVRDTGGVLFAW